MFTIMSSGPPFKKLKQSLLHFAPKQNLNDAAEVLPDTDKTKTQGIVKQTRMEIPWSLSPDFRAYQTPTNGNCFFAALADQLGMPMSEATTVRLRLVDHIRHFHHNLSAIEDWNCVVDSQGGLVKYLQTMARETTWADGVMIAAAVDLYERNIIIIPDDGSVHMEFTYMQKLSTGHPPLIFGYINRCHYVSLCRTCSLVSSNVTNITMPSSSVDPPQNHLQFQSTEQQYLVQEVLPLDLASEASHGPKQPVLYEFPTTESGKQNRRMNVGLYKQFPFIEYSTTTDSVFCFPCRMFPQTGGHTEPTFTNIGYNKWKNVHEKLRKHSETAVHVSAMSTWHMYKQTERTGTITKQLDIQRRAVITENRSYITSIARAAVTCARQGIALRGHRECESSSNRGNFIEIIDLVAVESPTFRMQRSNAAKNAQYIHHSIQNELLNICPNSVTETIISELHTSGIFAIMVDDSSDISLTEQMSICVRYVHECEIKERFLGFYDVHQIDAEGLKTKILTTLKSLRIDINSCVAQCYDGAAVMSGCAAGVQAKIREIVPSCIYVHCYNHRLNLVMVDTCKSIDSVADFFGVLQLAYVFLASRSSKRHDIFIDLQKKKRVTVLELPEPCETRWASRYACVRVFKERLSIIAQTLEELQKPIYKDRSAAAEASGILSHIKSHSFAFHLAMFYKLLGITKPLSDVLQGNRMDIGKALLLVTASKQLIADAREEFEAVFVESQIPSALTDSVTKSVDMSLTATAATKADKNANSLKSTTKRTTKLPASFSDFIVTEHLPSELCSSNRPSSCAETNKTEFRRIYFEVIDKMSCEMSERFSDSTSDIMMGIAACDPNNTDAFMKPCLLQPLADQFGVKSEALRAQAASVHAIVANCGVDRKPTTIAGILKLLECFRAGFEAVWRILQIALTVPVATAECERSFSVMKRVKSYLRSTMSQERLRDISILAIERELSDITVIDWDRVIDKFSEQDRRVCLRYDHS